MWRKHQKIDVGDLYYLSQSMVFYLRIYCISIPPKNDLEDLETMVDVIQKLKYLSIGRDPRERWSSWSFNGGSPIYGWF